jgi:hypothetical protein
MINWYKINIYNKTYLFIGGILGCGAAFYSAAVNDNGIIIIIAELIGIVFLLLAFRKPKEVNN